MYYNAYPVSIIERKIENTRIQMKFPEIQGLRNSEIQRRINDKIQDTVYKTIWNQGFDKDTAIIITGNTQISLNRAGILSIVLRMRFKGGLITTGYLKIKALTFNLQNGEVYKFEDLFKNGSDYIERINKIVKRQIVEQDILLLKKFKSIERDQRFYLSTDALIVYFPHSEYTSDNFGILEFAIPYQEIRDLAYEKGPLPKMEAQKLSISEIDNGKPIQLTKNTLLELSLQTNPSTGYTWQYIQKPNPEVIREMRHFLLPQGKNPGSPSLEYWQYSPVGVGMTQIGLEYKRSWSKEPPLKTFTVNIIIS